MSIHGERRRQALYVIAQAEIDGQIAPRAPVILHESAKLLHREIRADCAESLAQLARPPGSEIGEIRKQIGGGESVRRGSLQMDSIEGGADFP